MTTIYFKVTYNLFGVEFTENVTGLLSLFNPLDFLKDKLKVNYIQVSAS